MAYIDRETDRHIKVYDWEEGRFLSILAIGGLPKNQFFYLEAHAGLSPDGSLLASPGWLNNGSSD
jgi:hypothetical protein